MNRAIEVTVQGTVATAPVLTRQEGKKPYCRFRVAASYGQMVSGSWVNYDTLWFTAKAWGDLAEHLAQSFKRGDPVILCGRLGEDHWMRSGQRVSSMVLHLHCAGHDLTRGEAHYTKVVIIHDKAGDSGEAQLAAQRAGGAQAMGSPQAMSGPETMSAPEPASAPEAMSAPESMSGPDGPETACAPEITGVPGTNSSPDMGAALAAAIASQNGGPELVTPSLEAQDQWSTNYTLV
ncbi:MAG: single-stranded DNA-binding protein [Actinomyces graevenitzii]|uniref:Single-stranded DNA-binding protein n=1 Tax=Actinomyces graevenitzii TaxID=55565 RepID=A0A9E7DBX9_9ACTO|nr:single-stranded DNA-binding protein [Actinomyces graevenitzii]UQF79201.1 MAG: single-stranded DNA-binding protein [Actinomyces graevenitzii]